MFNENKNKLITSLNHPKTKHKQTNDPRQRMKQPHPQPMEAFQENVFHRDGLLPCRARLGSRSANSIFFLIPHDSILHKNPRA